jgi:hypothetical protein
VGFKGWATKESLLEHFSTTDAVDVVLQLEPPLYLVRDRKPADQIADTSGARCLGEMLIDLCDYLSSQTAKQVELWRYFKDT